MLTAPRRALWVVLAAVVLVGAAPAAADPGKPPFDVRDRQRQPQPGPETARQAQQRERLSDRLGRQGVLDFDGQTNTARFVGKLDGFLTGASGDDADKIALDYVRSQPGVFGLSASEIDDLKLVRRYADEGGTTHLVWAQVLDGITAFDNDLHANVARDGRLINVAGSPVAEFATRTTDPALSASDALGKALSDAGRRGARPAPRPKGTRDDLTTFAGGHDARLVLFTERPGDTHLAWEVTANKDADEVYDYVIDARSGQLLYRENTVDFAAANLNVWEYAPNIHSAPGFAGAPAQSGAQASHGTLFGGDPIQVNDGSALNGPYAHVYPDVDDDDAPDSEVPASSGTTWNYPFNPVVAGGNCDPTFPQCSWNGSGADATRNLRQNAAQVYFYVNNFHDWLQRDPSVGFTPASGNFETVGGDAVRAEVLDGAAILDGNHSNNANMATPRDGSPPRMQMFLFSGQGSAPFGNGGDDATVIYHEYAHGLSNRLVTGGTGSSTLRSFHAEAMGEGWSDFYAMDYIFDRGLDTGDNVATPGEVALGFYITGGETTFDLRSEPLDCPIGSTTPDGCPGGQTPHEGGYSLADMGDVSGGGPEVHADGEIWAQTLWQVRQTMAGSGSLDGTQVARRLITDGMRLSPPDPSFLDMRNAIMQADQVAFGGAHLGQLWNVFANRGMGAAASATSGDDTSPVASFTPPASNGTPVNGRVTDAATGAGVGGAYIHFDASGAPGDYATTTDSAGNYSLGAVQPGTIARVLVSAPGFGHAQRDNVAIGGNTVDFQVERNFAAAATGGAIPSFNGPNFSGDGCGPGGAIDGALATGWGSTSHNNPSQGLGGTKTIVVQLPQAIDVSRIAVDPTATCGDSDSASTGQFTIDVSSDGTNFRQVAATGFSSANLRRMNNVAGAAANVRFVRYTMVSPQRQLAAGGDGQGGQDSGVQFMDTSEVEVFGTPAAPTGGGGGGGGGGITRDLVAPIAKLGLVARQKIKTALAKGLKITVQCNEPCSANLTATLDAKTAKKLKLLKRKSKAKSVKVASGKLGLGPGKRTATLKFTRAAKTRLKKQKKLKLAISAALSDAAGNKASKKLTATLKR